MRDYNHNTVENYYKCHRCGYEWEDTWDCEVEDECPNCDTRHITPYKPEHYQAC